MPDINGIPYVESSDLVSAYPAVSQSLAQAVSDQLAEKADYPSGGSDGDLLTKSGTTTAWAAPSVAGLTLITSDSFSAVSSVSFDSCFTSTYLNYRVMLEMTTTTGGDIGFRLRVSGSDNTTSNYVTGGARTTTVGAITGTGGVSDRYRFITATGAGLYSFASMDVIQPQIAKNTGYATLSTGYAAGTSQYTGEYNTGQFTATTQFDGFTLLTSGGTMTGTIRIYAYKD